MEIRKATHEDIPLIIKNRMEFVRNIAKGNPTEQFEIDTYNFINNHIDDETFIAWLAIENNQIVSIAVICIYELLPTKSNLTGYIQNVYTLEEYRKKGLATQLLKRLIDDAKNKGVGNIYLHATDEGKYVYDKLGFEINSDGMLLKIL